MSTRPNCDAQGATMIDTGSAVLSPDRPLVAGSYSSLALTYTAGHPIDDSGYLKIVFRGVNDFGAPQFTQPGEPNYCSLSTTGDCRLIPRWDSKGHFRPWNKSLYVQVTGGYLDRGETITVSFGDRTGGSPGWLVPTFRQKAFQFKTLVDPIASYQFKEVASSPAVPIIAGEPNRAVCLAPSQVPTGTSLSYFLRIEDRWGNPTGKPERFEHPGFGAPGVYTLTGVSETTGLTAVSNPISVVSSETVRLNHYWADFHGQSEETVGTGTIEDYFHFARDYAFLDICAHQGNDFQIDDAFWDKIVSTTDLFNEPGRFVAFAGYEWSGNTPLGGDRNVLYAGRGGAISRSSRELIPDNRSVYPDSPTAEHLFAALRKDANNSLPFVFAHVGGRYADIAMHDDEIEVAVEVHSAWGTFEWLVEEALDRGYRVGIAGNSDGHKCRPGSSYPGAGEFGSLGGLTCVLAESLDRESLYRAIKARRFYATTGNRPLLSVRVVGSEGQEAPMGGSLSGTSLKLFATVSATAPLERLEVRNGRDDAVVLRPYTAEQLGPRVKVLWSGAEVKGRARMTRWDGRLEVSDNCIVDAQPINFWNPLRPVERRGDTGLSWISTTTGGFSGVIVELENKTEGELLIETAQGTIRCQVADIGIDPITQVYGGLRKRLDIYRLPEERQVEPFSVQVDLETQPGRPEGALRLRKGTNPVYLCAVQEDGHMAWSSPVYITVP